MRAQRDALLDEAAHRFRISDIGRFDGAAGAHLIAQLARARFQIRLLAARRGDLGIDFGELLVRQGRIVAADEQIRLHAILFDLGLGIRDLGAHLVDLDGEPVASGAGLILLGRLLHGEIGLRDAIGHASGEFGIGRVEIDCDDARLLDGEDTQTLIVGLKRALFPAHRARIAAEADKPEQRIGDTAAGIELHIFVELFLLDHIAGDVARQRDLNLAGHGFRIEIAALGGVLFRLGAHEDIFAHFEQQPRFGAVTRGDGVDDDESGRRRDQREAKDGGLFGPQKPAEPHNIGLPGGVQRRDDRRDHRCNDGSRRGGRLGLTTEKHPYSKHPVR